MNKIIILKGKSNVGKTTKINQIADWIITAYGCPNSINLDPSDYSKDTHGVLTINRLTIGINSAGDSEAEVKKLDHFIASGSKPDIILCSCRTKGKTRKYIHENYGYTNGWLKVHINVEEYSKTDLQNQNLRDIRIIDEIKTWLIGLQK